MNLLNVYVFFITAMGFVASTLNFHLSNLTHSVALFLLGVIGILFIIAEVELFHERYYSGASIVIFVTYFLYGISNALIVISVLSLFEAIYYKIEIKKGLFNFGQFALCMIISSKFYELLGGSNVESIDLQKIILMVILSISYQILNIIFLSVIYQIIRRGSYIKLLQEEVYNVFLFSSTTTLLSIYLVFSSINQKDYTVFIHLLFLYIIFLVVRYIFQHYIKLRKSQISLIESLAQMTDEKTHQDQHAARVGWIAKQIGEAIKLPAEQLDQLYYAAMFHDIGKTSINDKIFRKRGPLTLEEQKEYESHVTLGAEWLNKIHGFSAISEVVLHHHEQWNGKGFPNGLVESRIPHLSRIVAVANKLDHLLSENKSNAFKNLNKLAGSALDPELVKITIDLPTILDRYNDSQEMPEWIKMSDYVSDVRQKIYNSELLNHFGVNLIVNYENGRFYSPTNPQVSVPCSAEIKTLAEKSIREGRPIRHNLHDSETGKIYDVYCLPIGSTTNILLFDVTQVIQYESEQEQKMRKIYKDVIYAVTQGKMLLIEKDELDGYLQGHLEVSHVIQVSTDITASRHLISEKVSTRFDDKKRAYQILLCINECLTNVLKHAQKGEMRVYSDEQGYRILIQDNGSGIDLADLPKSTLMQGYSTKLSLGQGFKLMMTYADRLILATNSSGTSIVLEFHTGTMAPLVEKGDLLIDKEGISYA